MKFGIMKFSIATIVTILASSALAAPAKEIVQRSGQPLERASEGKFMKRQFPVDEVTGLLGGIPGASSIAQLGKPPGEDANGNTNSVNTSDPQAIAAANEALEEERHLEQEEKQRNAAQEADPDNGQDGTSDGSDTDDLIPTQQDDASGTTTASATGTTSMPAATTAPAPAAAPPAPQRDASDLGGLGGIGGLLGPVATLLGGNLLIKK